MDNQIQGKRPKYSAWRVFYADAITEILLWKKNKVKLRISPKATDKKMRAEACEQRERIISDKSFGSFGRLQKNKTPFEVNTLLCMELFQYCTSLSLSTPQLLKLTQDRLFSQCILSPLSSNDFMMPASWSKYSCHLFWTSSFEEYNSARSKNIL